MKTLKLVATLRDIVGARELTVPFEGGQTVRELIQSIAEVSPALGDEIITGDGELTGTVHILVHGRNIVWLEGLDTTVREEDAIVLIPPAAGG